MNDSATYRSYLEDMTQQRKYVKIQYFTDFHALVTLNAMIRAITTESNVEQLTLSTGIIVLLSQLVSVDGRFAPDYDSYQLYCDTCDC